MDDPLCRTPCICCFSIERPLVDLSTCDHTQFIVDIFVKYTMDLTNTFLCNICHSILRLSHLLRKQISDNCRDMGHHFNKGNQKFLTQSIVTKDLRNLFVTQMLNVSILDNSEDNEKPDISYIEVHTDLKYNIDAEINDEELFTEENFKVESEDLKTNVKKQKTNKKKSKLKIKQEKINTNQIAKIKLSHDDLIKERRMDAESVPYLQLPYKCESCVIGFDYERSYQVHMDQRHNTNGTYKCEICTSVFDKKASYVIHYKRHFIRYECLVCGRRMVSKEPMQKHYMTVHEDEGAIEYPCELCSHVSLSKRSHRYHKEKHSNHRPQCHDCRKVFTNKYTYQHHLDRYHDKSVKRSYKCERCLKVYKCKSSLLMHKLTHIQNNEQAFCKTCKIQFKTVYNYNYHLKSHSKHATDENKKFVCEECSAKFLTKTRLQDHIGWEHLKNSGYTCDICNKKYKRKRALEKHIQYVHEKVRPPREKMCDHCGRGFTTNAILAAHIRTHTGERPLQCRHCPANFAHSSALYTHNKLLHKNKP